MGFVHTVYWSCYDWYITEDEDEDEDEQVEFTSLPPTEGSVLTAFVHKEAED